MLQDPGKAHNGPWKVDCRACQQFGVHDYGELLLLMWLGCFVLRSQAGEDSVGCLQVFRSLWRELACQSPIQLSMKLQPRISSPLPSQQVQLTCQHQKGFFVG